MKYLLWALLLSIIPSSVTARSADVIGIYGDQTGYCLLLDNPGPATLYVIQKFSVGATGSRFRIEFSPGFDGTLISVSAPVGSFTGDPIGGLTMNYGSCLAGTFEVLEVHMMMSGASPECSWVRTAAHPLSIDGKIDTYDCIAARAGAEWQGTHVQHDFFRFCPDLDTGENHNPPSCRPYTPTIATDAATWGAVKALYR